MLETVRAWLAKGEELGVSRRRIVIFGLVFLALAAGRLLERIPADKVLDAYKVTLDIAWWLFVTYAFDKGFQYWLQARGIPVNGNGSGNGHGHGRSPPPPAAAS